MTDNAAAPSGGDGVDERLRLLEARVQTLAEAVHALSNGLEERPAQEEPTETRAARGARLAHELLLSQRL